MRIAALLQTVLGLMRLVEGCCPEVGVKMRKVVALKAWLWV